MSEHVDPREQAEASAQQDLEPKDLEPKDLEPKSQEADQVRGGQGTNKSFEIKDFSFGVENPTTI